MLLMKFVRPGVCRPWSEGAVDVLKREKPSRGMAFPNYFFRERPPKGGDSALIELLGQTCATYVNPYLDNINDSTTFHHDRKTALLQKFCDDKLKRNFG
jgi:hypothetical protein